MKIQKFEKEILEEWFQKELKKRFQEVDLLEPRLLDQENYTLDNVKALVPRRQIHSATVDLLERISERHYE